MLDDRALALPNFFQSTNHGPYGKKALPNGLTFNQQAQIVRLTAYPKIL